MIYQLKIRPEYFHDVVSGKKPFEVRFNDRNYKVGDYLALNECSDSGYTGRSCLVRVTYVLDDETFCKSGFVIMGIDMCELKIWPLLRTDSWGSFREEG